jgi:hypothetical protein
MTLQEAIKKSIETNDWFRPISWKGAVCAYCIHKGDTQLVPTRSGGTLHMITSVNGLMGDWEVVSPDQVLNGE